MPVVDVEFAIIVFRVYVDGMPIREMRVVSKERRKRNEVDVHYRLRVEAGRTVTVEYVAFRPKRSYRPDIWCFLAKGGGVDIWEYGYDPAKLPRKYTFKMPNARVKVVLCGQVKRAEERYLLTVYVWLEPPAPPEEKPPAPSPVPAPEEAPSVRASRMSAVAGGALGALVLLLAALAAAKHR